MDGVLGAASHLFHYFGFAMAVGASIVAQKALRTARSETSAPKSGMEKVASSAVTWVELPGLFIAIFGGILGLVANPAHLSVTASGAGPWLHIKLSFVLALLVVAHLRMFRVVRLVRERASGANEADCDAILRKALVLGSVEQALIGVVFLIATFRFVLFGA